MTRFLLALVVGFAASPLAVAQDMNLHQILAEGESWKELPRSEFKPPEQAFGEHRTRTFVYSPKADRFWYTLPGEKAIFQVEVNGGKITRHAVALVQPADLELWADEQTLVVGDSGGKHLWAFRLTAEGTPTDPEPYYPLFVRPGTKASGVSWLTRDDQKRIYAVVPNGVQVFDPTGRLSGVIALPARGEAAFLTLNGNDLLLGIGGKVYTRKLQASAKPTP